MFEEVASVIGKAAAAKLARAFPGVSIYVPVPVDDSIAKRNDRIRKERKAGAAIDALMKHYSLSRRSIWAALKGS